ncbi:hypothetical protein [uncultured Methylobacterium sp.]|uniref:hypothetical protein n=1 Tax=uncultured Methylobacterium sp. TaxID=157278 RepID=UPI0035CA00E4
MSEQGPNVTDPDARALIAAASAATTAIDFLLCAVRDGEAPNIEEIATALADALNLMLSAYPSPSSDDETRALHLAACGFLGLDHPSLD